MDPQALMAFRAAVTKDHQLHPRSPPECHHQTSTYLVSPATPSFTATIITATAWADLGYHLDFDESSGSRPNYSILFFMSDLRLWHSAAVSQSTIVVVGSDITMILITSSFKQAQVHFPDFIPSWLSLASLSLSEKLDSLLLALATLLVCKQILSNPSCSDRSILLSNELRGEILRYSVFYQY